MITRLGLLVSVASFLLAGCIDLNGSRKQTVVVDTPLVEGAECYLTDNRGKRWYVGETPDVITIIKGYGPLVVDCTRKGYKHTITHIQEEYPTDRNYQYVANSVIRGVRDVTSSIVKQYPERIVVLMEPETFSSEQEKIDWLTVKESYDKLYQGTEHAENIRKGVPDEAEYRLIQQLEALEAKQKEAEERVLKGGQSDAVREEQIREKEERIRAFIEKRAELKEQLNTIQEEKAPESTWNPNQDIAPDNGKKPVSITPLMKE